MSTIDLVVILLKCVFAVALVMQLEPLLIWGERKIAAYIQDRAGPNRADIGGIRAGGLVHSLSDVVKLITKEDVRPDHVDKGFWIAAPILAMSVALMTFVVIPWGDHLVLPFLDQPVGLQVASINGGLLYILAVTSLGVYGIMLAGWSSNNKYSLLGGLRSSAQMVSYELAMGLSLVVMFMCFGTVQLDEIASLQAGSIFHWGVFQAFPLGLIAFVVFWVAVFAETNRTPFDLPEAEAELVGGYHTEYSSLRFALFFMAEYANMIVGSAVTATVFFGGYNFPFLDGGQLREHADQVLVAAGAGGAAVFAAALVISQKRKGRPFYQALPADDPRHREPKVFGAIWSALALAHLGLVGLGLSGMVGATVLGPELVAFVVHLTMLVVKILIGCFVMIQIRWTLPRFRYDQLMDLGWKVLLPVSVANIFATGVWLVAASALTA